MNSNELQLLSVSLADDIYGIDITKVQEIRALGAFRSIPNLPTHCIGVIDFRDSMVPVVDLRDMFGYQHSDVSSQTVIVVMLVDFQSEQLLLGIVVDAVSDVISMDASRLKSTPTMGNKVDTSFIKGMFKHDNQIVVVLMLEAIMEADDSINLQAMSELNKSMVSPS